MKCQNYFLGKIDKNISKCHLLNFLPSMQSQETSGQIKHNLDKKKVWYEMLRIF